MIRVMVHEQGPHAVVSSETTQGDSKSNLKQLWDSLATSVDLHRCFADDSNTLSGACAGLCGVFASSRL